MQTFAWQSLYTGQEQRRLDPLSSHCSSYTKNYFTDPPRHLLLSLSGLE